MSAEASRILMKVLWCAWLARPDLNKETQILHVDLRVGVVADDKRPQRLMSCLFGSRKFTLKGHIRDPPELWRLCCYTDADHCSAQGDTKSTSGMYDHDAGRSTFMVATLMGKPQADINRTQHHRSRNGVFGCRSVG